MPISKLRPEYTLQDDRLEHMKALFPEAVADGELDWDALRDILGAQEEEDGDIERFGLFWPGKHQARRAAAIPPRGTLVPCPGEGIDEDTTHNIFIEGENLEVLKLLRKAYAGKVKMIYIDPPYNTGDDHVYADDYAEPVEAYLRRTGQTGEAGEPLTTNKRTSGRFHSNWLNAIYPRLVLASQLLHPHGAIFISIDDNEVHNLRLLMDEVFGQANFLAACIWQKRVTPENRRAFSFAHDYLLLYAKDAEAYSEHRHLLPMTQEALSRYRNPDNDPRGPWQSVPAVAQAGHATPSQFYVFVTPDARRLEPPPGCCWRYTEKRMRTEVALNNMWFGGDGKGVPRIKRFLSDTRQGITPSTIWYARDVDSNEKAKKQLQDLFGGEVVFDSPKPIRLVQRMLDIVVGADDEALVLDFYAGSGTTGHAVFEQNREHAKAYRFIMIQLQETMDSDSATGRAATQLGLRTVADVAKERLRRAISSMKDQRPQQLSLEQRTEREELGFKVFELRRSNFKRWADHEGESVAQLQERLDAFESPLVQGWSPEDLLVEVILQEGFALHSRVTRSRALGENAVAIVSSEACEHRLWVCLDAELSGETVAALSHPETDFAEQDIFVCLDAALTDELKLRLDDRLNVKVI